MLKKLFIAALFCACCLSCTNSPPSQKPAPHSLTISEGFVSPLGFYDATPTFSWKLPVSTTPAWMSQKAYQIILMRGDDDVTLWDSGKVISNQSTWIPYAGKPINSRDTLQWRVRYWNQLDQASTWSDAIQFEMGLLQNSDWQAQWIGLPKASYVTKSKYDTTRYQPAHLRKTFALDKKISKARLYITAKGLFEAHLNGKRVGKDVMTPGWTPYDTHIETLTYDVTDLLQSGDNAIGVVLASGWYAGRLGYSPKHWVEKSPPRLLVQLEMFDEQGQSTMVVSDTSWKVTLDGPIRQASIYDGETFDARSELPGWRKATFSDENWQPVATETIDNKVALTPKRHSTVREKFVLNPVSMVVMAPGKVVFDFGQNMVGVPKLTMPVNLGETIQVRFAEMLQKDGNVYTDNYRSAASTNYYIANKTKTIEWQPKFTFHGFRYVEVSGFDPALTPNTDWVKAVGLYSDFDSHGTFSSSHQKLNQLQSNIQWGLKGNFLDIPTDCPQRDERLGWTGDAQVFASTALFNADTHSFWASWLQSMRETQDADGGIHVYVPTTPETKRIVSPGWFDAATIIPWEVYLRTGDERVLTENFNMMENVIKFYKTKASDNIVDLKGFGDWLQPYPLQGDDGQRGDTAMALIATAFYTHSLDLTHRAAGILGKSDLAENYLSQFSAVKAAFEQRFFAPDGTLKEGAQTQTAYLLALGFDLLSPALKEKAIPHLLTAIHQADGHLRTGFLGTPLLAPVLDAIGKTDLAYDILFKETYPSWFYSINQGATTMWERWDSYSHDKGFNPGGMNSFNHYAYGAIGEWMYERIAGIQPIEPGYKRIRFAPAFNGPLQSANASHQSPYGLIESGWHKSDGKITYNITVPPNTQGEVVLPNKNTLKLNGKPLETVLAANKIHSTETQLILTVTPGSYTFAL